MAFRDEVGLGELQPTLDSVLAAKLRMRQRGAALQAAEEKLKKGELWREAVEQRRVEHEAAANNHSQLNKVFESRQHAAIKAGSKAHADAAAEYSRAIENVGRLEREAVLSELDIVFRRESVNILTRAAESEPDKAVADWLTTYSRLEGDKLAVIVEAQEAKRAEAAALKSQLPAMQKAMGTALAALAV